MQNQIHFCLRIDQRYQTVMEAPFKAVALAMQIERFPIIVALQFSLNIYGSSHFDLYILQPFCLLQFHITFWIQVYYNSYSVYWRENIFLIFCLIAYRRFLNCAATKGVARGASHFKRYISFVGYWTQKEICPWIWNIYIRLGM